MEQQSSSVFILLSTTFVTLLGSMAKLLSNIESKRLTKLAAISSISFSVFAGLLIGLIGLGLNLSHAYMPLLSAAGGIVGWAGKAFMDRFTLKVTNAITDKVASTINPATTTNPTTTATSDNV